MLQDPDSWWHIKTGEWIWQNRAFPVKDAFSHTFAGQPWIAKEWLSQILLFCGFAAAGWNGVVLVTTAALIVAAIALFQNANQTLNPLMALAVTVVAIGCLSPVLLARPHLLSLPLVVIWTGLLFSASWRGRPPPFAALLVLVVWANLHAGFTIGFVIAGFAGLDALERHPAARAALLPRWLLFLALCPVVSLLHPYGVAPLLASWHAAFPAEQSIDILEWRPVEAQSYPILVACLLGLLFAALVTGFRLGIARALLLVALLYLYLLHVRFLFYFYPVVAVVVAPEMARQFPRFSAAAWRESPRDFLEIRLLRHFRPVAAGLAGAILLLAVLAGLVLRPAPPEEASVSGAIAYAQARGLSGNVFNDYDFGGPLIFHGIPTFIDGRSDQLFRAKGFSVAYGHGPMEASALAAALDRFAITWSLLRPGDKRVALLDAMPGWRRTYGDQYAVIHERLGKIAGGAAGPGASNSRQAGAEDGSALRRPE